MSHLSSARGQVNETSFADDLMLAIEAHGADMDAAELAEIEDYFRRRRGRERLIEAGVEAMNCQFGLPANESEWI